MSIFNEISSFKALLASGLAQKKDLTKIKQLLKSDISGLPNYIKQYLNDIEKISKFTKKNNKNITILDHGCGSGTVVIILLALGYESICGLDVREEKCFKYNKSLRKILNINRDIFITYDNGKIPLPDDSVNYIYSNQVLEHVAPDLIDEFLFEENRIKNPISIIRHSFPVRNCFFETHTNTAVLHWFLPRKIFNKLFNKQKQVWLENNLFLNWSKFYEKNLINV